jgi:hypothetical protein
MEPKENQYIYKIPHLGIICLDTETYQDIITLINHPFLKITGLVVVYLVIGGRKAIP